MKTWPAAALALLLGACGKDSLPEQPPADFVPAQAAPSDHPVDHLAPNELLEGDESALGLVLPRGAHVEHAFPDDVYVSSTAPLPALVEYVRTRVRDGSFTRSQYTATFSHVKVPSRPGHEIEISLHDQPGFRCDIQLRETTPPDVPAQPDEASRMRAQGLKPSGGLLDPTHAE